MSVFRS